MRKKKSEGWKIIWPHLDGDGLYLNFAGDVLTLLSCQGSHQLNIPQQSSWGKIRSFPRRVYLCALGHLLLIVGQTRILYLPSLMSYIFHLNQYRLEPGGHFGFWHKEIERNRGSNRQRGKETRGKGNKTSMNVIAAFLSLLRPVPLRLLKKVRLKVPNLLTHSY